MNTVLSAMAGSANRIQALAWNGMRQAVRDKVLYVLVGFCALLIGGSTIVSQLTVGERARIVMNLGLSATSVLSTLTAIFVTINQVAREIDRKSIASILTKPVARWELLAGRFAGMATTLAAIQLTMVLLHCAVLASVDGYQSALWKAAWLGYIETLVVAALALFLSAFITTLPAIFLSLAFVVIGHTSEGLALMADRTESQATRFALEWLQRILPNLDVLNVRAQVAWGVDIPTSMLANGTLYGLGYATVLIVLGAFLFSRRDLA